MNAEIGLPYIETKDNFDTKELSKEVYIGNLHEEYDGTFDRLDGFNKCQRDYLDKKYGRSEIPDKKKFKEVPMKIYKTKCTLQAMNGEDLTSGELREHYVDEDMFILRMNFDTLLPDIESEMKFWVKDSMSINEHDEIEQKEKLMMLPEKTLHLYTKFFNGKLIDCKVIDYEEVERQEGEVAEGPFSIAVLIKKITR